MEALRSYSTTITTTIAFNTINRGNRNLKELLSASLCLNSKTTKSKSIISGNSCNICKKYMVLKNTFACTVAGKKIMLKVS